MKSIKLIVVYLLVLPMLISAQTTGKVYGKVFDAETKKPLAAASINLVDTKLGAATDYEGNYFIINIPPGQYLLKYKAIGYEVHSINKIIIKAGISTDLSIYLTPSKVYEITEKQEQFYLGLISKEKLNELAKLKIDDKIKYQRILIETYFRESEQSMTKSEDVQEQILKLNKKIQIKADEYRIAKNKKDGDEDYNEYKMKKYSKELFKLLGERFSLKEEKMKLELEYLKQGLEELKNELAKFKGEKDNIIKAQFNDLTK